jgi:hypothetical protein
MEVQKNKFKTTSFAFLSILIMGFTSNYSVAQLTERAFEISFSKSLIGTAQDGRLLLLLSQDSSSEPRFQISSGTNTQLVFGINVDKWEPEEKVRVNSSAYGYPIENLNNLPDGTYYAQALLNRYETFNLSDGRTLKLPPDKGEGQQWNEKPGNFYSEPIEIEINADQNVHTLELDNKIPPIPLPEDTKYIKHVEMRSELLSEFWGRDVNLRANVLLPKGFEEHPDAKYPLMIFHGHFPYDFGGFRTTPPDSTLEPVYSDRFNWDGYNITQQKENYEFYKKWTTKGIPLYDRTEEWIDYKRLTPNGTYEHFEKRIKGDKPRYIIITIQHPTPYYDDSYAVNSANQGPYGDAITYELVPFIEKKFRGIGKEWSRYLYGGSTGGWEALAAQVKYPEEYGGAFAACPDPIDFRAFETVNIYEDKNAYYLDSQFKKTARPAHRNYLGHVSSTVKEQNQMELALGTNTRSGQQWDIWEATFSPAGDNGYPARIWNKKTGKINQEVAQYWKEKYDLRYILERDWEKGLGEKLKGKIHIYVGDMDNYYLNNAVYFMEDFLENTTNPYYAGEVDYGDRAEHCWNGDQRLPNALSRLHYNTQYLPEILRLIKEKAPKGADLSSWRY